MWDLNRVCYREAFQSCLPPAHDGEGWRRQCCPDSGKPPEITNRTELRQICSIKTHRKHRLSLGWIDECCVVLCLVWGVSVTQTENTRSASCEPFCESAHYPQLWAEHREDGVRGPVSLCCLFYLTLLKHIHKLHLYFRFIFAMTDGLGLILNASWKGNVADEQHLDRKGPTDGKDKPRLSVIRSTLELTSFKSGAALSLTTECVLLQVLPEIGRVSWRGLWSFRGQHFFLWSGPPLGLCVPIPLHRA